MPIAIASRSCSSASAGPSVSTTDSPPCASTSRIASSTPHSSCGLIVNPRCFVSSACSSAVSTILPPVRGTRFTQTRIFIQDRILRFSGSKTGRGPTTSTVTGKRSVMYSTASSFEPSTACSGGR